MTSRQIALSVALALAALSTGCAPLSDARPAPAKLVALSKPLTWPDLLTRPRPAPDKTFRYGPDPYQVVDLWRPAGRGPHPVVLMVHGGCWTTGIADRSIMAWAAADLRARGLAVWNIDYRGVDRLGGAPNGIFADVAAAADLLRTHAAAERLDIRRVVAVGHSAGGHLALWLAARPKVGKRNLPAQLDPLPISHVVSLGGLPDLAQAASETQGCGPGPIARLVAPDPSVIIVRSGPRVRLPKSNEFNLGQFADDGGYADKSIPLLAPLGVPQTLINGDADKIIPTRFANDYAARMRAAGDNVTVRIVPGQGHVELIAPGTPAWAAAVAAIKAALQ